MTEFEKGYEQGYKDGMAGAALPNVNDNGDKIDGYSYAYKTDSNGEPYIHIDSVRGMLKEARRLLKAAVEDINAAEACDTCEYYPIINSDMCQKDDCYKWRYADEALALIGEEGENDA